MGVEAWYMDDLPGDQREPHRKVPNEPVSAAQLKELGVNSWQMDPTIYENDPKLEALRKEKGFSYFDIINCCPDKLPGYADKIKMFYEEHIHADDEVRYCLEGSGYFDVRDKQDRWIRVAVDAGAMISVPAGLYHRFTNDSNNYIKAMRLFIGDPVWTPINRPEADAHPMRRDFLHKIEENAFATQRP
eukprot:EG_transcript_25256